MNIIQISENNYVDAPIVDTRLTPKWIGKQPKATHPKLGPRASDWQFLRRVTTSWNPTCLLWVHLCLDLGCFLGVCEWLVLLWGISTFILLLTIGNFRGFGNSDFTWISKPWIGKYVGCIGFGEWTSLYQWDLAHASTSWRWHKPMSRARCKMQCLWLATLSWMLYLN